MENENKGLEIDAVKVVEKLTNRVAEDAQKIAILEATLELYVSQLEEMSKQLHMLQEIQKQ